MALFLSGDIHEGIYISKDLFMFSVRYRSIETI